MKIVGACGVLLIVAMVAFPSAAAGMTMTVAGDQIVASGRIVPEDAQQFQALMDANPHVRSVVLWDSPGGSAAANDRITAIIEAHNLNTVVAGYCVSACAMIFLSGTNRAFGDLAPMDATSLGFHGNYVNGELGTGARLADLKQRVLDRTGGKIDPALVDRWLHLTDDRSSIRFRYPGAAPSTAPTVYFCPIGRFPNGGQYDSCEPINGTNALSSGVITSTQVVHVNR